MVIMMKMTTMIMQTESVELSKDLLHHEDGVHHCNVEEEEVVDDEADDDDTKSVELSKDLLHQSKKLARKQQQLESGRRDENLRTIQIQTQTQLQIQIQTQAKLQI